MINPLDWNKTPDYVNIDLDENYITMDIDVFFRMLNQSDKDFRIMIDDKQIVLDKQTLKEKVEQEFYDYNTPNLNDYLKVIITIIEGTIIFIIGNKVVAILENKKEKIKKL